MQEGWDKPLWISRLLKQNKQDIMDKLDSIENIFKKAGDATATDSDIVKPKTAYNGNTLLTGTLEDKTGTTSYTANTTLDSTNKLLRMQVPSVGKYGVGNYLQQSFANIANLIGLTSAKLLKNNTVLGITGNSSNMDTSACDAAAAQILSGKKAGVKGNTVTGTMANKAGTTVKAAAVTQDDNNTYFALPVAGYYDTASKVYTENSNLVSVKGKHWATFQELTTYECMLEVDNVYLVYTPGLPVTFTNASILSEKTLTTQGGVKYYCYLIKANSDIINMDISHNGYTIFVSPSLGKALTSTSFTIKTNSESAFTINTVTNGIYSYFVNCRANFTNAEVLSYVKDNDGFAYLIKAKSTFITVTNTDGAIYGGAFSSKLN